MSFNKKFFTTGGIVASTPSAPAGLDPLQNFETVTYTGNGSTQKITGYIRKGAAFNGSSSKIDLPNSLDLATGNNNFTVSFWVNTNDTSNDEIYISLLRNYFFYVRKFSTNEIYIELGNSDSVNTGVSLTQNTWTHIAVTKSSSTGLILYKGGTAVATYSSKTGNIAAGGDPNQIGIYNNSSSYAVDGKIDQVRLFNTALNPTQVGELALEKYADPKKSTTDYFGDGSGVALYELDEDANDTGVYPLGQGAIDSGQSGFFGGNNDRLTASNFSSVLGTNRAFTISGWFFPSSISNTLDAITAWSTTGTTAANFVLGRHSGGTWQYRLGHANSNEIKVVFSDSYEVDKWVHVAFTYDGSKNASGVTLYLNGVAATVSSINDNNLTTNTDYPNFAIGYGAWNGDYYNGYVDQVRIYSSELSSSEVNDLANETNVPTSTLVAHYKLDGNANDETTNYNGSAPGVTYSDPAEFPLNQYNGTPTNVNFLGMAFQPDFVWVKRRDSGIGGTNHLLFDSVRGAGERLSSDNANQEYTLTDEVTSFDSNGFTVGADASANGSGGSIVAWCWKAGGNSNTFNVDGIGYSSASAAGLATGTNNPTGASVNTKSGFSIIKLNSGSVANSDRTVAHGLGVKPSFVLFRRTSLSAWFTWSAGLSPESYYLYLQESYGVNDLTQSSNAWGNQSFTDTTISWRNSWTFSPNEELIAYVWADIPGYQKSGSYTGTGTSQTINVGFQPRFVMIKSTTASSTSWVMIDSLRDNADEWLYANESSATFDDANTYTQLNSNGFTVNLTASYVNASGHTYIYLAIA